MKGLLFVFIAALALHGAAAFSCSDVSDCTTCVGLSRCGWCPDIGACTAGDVDGPLENANCTQWAFGFCAGEPCRVHTDCASCTADSFCGWCASSGTCAQGGKHGPMFGRCSKWGSEPAVCSHTGGAASHAEYAEADPDAIKRALTHHKRGAVPKAHDENVPVRPVEVVKATEEQEQPQQEEQPQEEQLQEEEPHVLHFRFALPLEHEEEPRALPRPSEEEEASMGDATMEGPAPLPIHLFMHRAHPRVLLRMLGHDVNDGEPLPMHLLRGNVHPRVLRMMAGEPMPARGPLPLSFVHRLFGGPHMVPPQVLAHHRMLMEQAQQEGEQGDESMADVINHAVARALIAKAHEEIAHEHEHEDGHIEASLPPVERLVPAPVEGGMPPALLEKLAEMARAAHEQEEEGAGAREEQQEGGPVHVTEVIERIPIMRVHTPDGGERLVRMGAPQVQRIERDLPMPTGGSDEHAAEDVRAEELREHLREEMAQHAAMEQKRAALRVKLDALAREEAKLKALQHDLE